MSRESKVFQEMVRVDMFSERQEMEAGDTELKL